MGKIAICIPSKDGAIKTQTLECLDRDMLALRRRGDVVGLVTSTGTSTPHWARHKLMTAARTASADRYVMIDDDMAWEEGGLVRLVDHPVDFVGAPYLMKDPTRAQWHVSHLPFEDVRVEENGLIEVAFVAIGLACVSARVFDALDRDFGSHHFSELDGEPEDLSFVARWRKSGGKVWCDPHIETCHIAGPTLEFRGRLIDVLTGKDWPMLGGLELPGRSASEYSR